MHLESRIDLEKRYRILKRKELSTLPLHLPYIPGFFERRGNNTHLTSSTLTSCHAITRTNHHITGYDNPISAHIQRGSYVWMRRRHGRRCAIERQIIQVPMQLGIENEGLTWGREGNKQFGTADAYLAGAIPCGEKTEMQEGYRLTHHQHGIFERTLLLV
jgi:hypothetical protein